MTTRPPEYYRDRYERHRQEGRCVCCSAPARAGKTACARCAETYAARMRARREALRAAGACLDCGADAAPFARCRPCRVRQAAAIADLRTGPPVVSPTVARGPSPGPFEAASVEVEW